jgi:hypothetical protein
LEKKQTTLKIRLLGLVIPILFSLSLSFLGFFSSATVEGRLFASHESFLTESHSVFDDFGLTPEQIHSSQSGDEAKESSKNVMGTIPQQLYLFAGFSTKLLAIFSSKFTFADLSILFHNLRI